MNRFGKLFAICILAVSMLWVLSACGAEDTAADPVTSTAPSAEEIVLAAEGKSDYVLVYPADATKAEKTRYEDFARRLRALIQCFFTLQTDEAPAAEGAKEILLGNTNRPQSEAAKARLEKDQIGFFVIDQQVAIVSTFKEGFEYAGDEFIKRCVADSAIKVTADQAVRIQCEKEWGHDEFSNLHDIGGDDPYVVEHDGSYYYC